MVTAFVHGHCNWYSPDWHPWSDRGTFCPLLMTSLFGLLSFPKERITAKMERDWKIELKRKTSRGMWPQLTQICCHAIHSQSIFPSWIFLYWVSNKDVLIRLQITLVVRGWCINCKPCKRRQIKIKNLLITLILCVPSHSTHTEIWISSLSIFTEVTHCDEKITVKSDTALCIPLIMRHNC